MLQHTFVICAYKQSAFLEKCIQSCMAQQTFLDSQSMIIVYTSTPNESISSLVAKYDLPLYVGMGGSIGKDWNNALSFVKTKYATIAHQDDIYLPNYGTKIVEAFNKNRDATIAFSDYEENDFQDQLRRRSINLKIKTFGLTLVNLSSWKWYQRRIYAFGNFICCPAVSFNLEKLKNFRFDDRMKMAVDWDAWERIMKLSGKIIFIPEKLMYHRIHEDSETTANTIDKAREKEEYEMFKRYWGTGIAKLLMKFYVKNQKSNQV